MDRNPDDTGFDLNAASLRADRADLPALVDVLASRLESALPTECDVTRRRRSVFSRNTGVERVVVELGDRRFLLPWRRRELVAEVQSSVHDMRRSSATVELHDWFLALQDELCVQAGSDARPVPRSSACSTSDGRRVAVGAPSRSRGLLTSPR